MCAEFTGKLLMHLKRDLHRYVCMCVNVRKVFYDPKFVILLPPAHGTCVYECDKGPLLIKICNFIYTNMFVLTCLGGSKHLVTHLLNILTPKSHLPKIAIFESILNRKLLA